MWHDIKTNFRGKALEEFLTYSQLHIINKDNTMTFQSSRGSINIDLTIGNNHMLAAIKDWEILEEESCSDHNIIKYNLKFKPGKEHKYNFQKPRFVLKENQHADFHKKFRRHILKNFQVGNNSGNISEIDERLTQTLRSQEDVGIFIDRIYNTVRTTCTETFKHHTSLKCIQRGNQSLRGR